MTIKQDVGKIGENLACDYLRQKKYKILERNHRQKYGEIDIIAKKKDGLLVFVEVKTIQLRHCEGAESDCGNPCSEPVESVITPEDQMTSAKLKRVQKTAYIYANSHLDLVNDKRGWQIDLIAIELEPFAIRHYENI